MYRVTFLDLINHEKCSKMLQERIYLFGTSKEPLPSIYQAETSSILQKGLLNAMISKLWDFHAEADAYPTLEGDQA